MRFASPALALLLAFSLAATGCSGAGGAKEPDGNGATPTPEDAARLDDLQRRTFDRLNHSQFGVSRQQINHQAVMGRIKVQNQDERRLHISRNVTQQGAAGLQPPGRGPDRDDWKVPLCRPWPPRVHSYHQNE